MDSFISIKIDYKHNRKNPEDIFKAMSLYISAQKRYGNLLAKSLELNVNYELTLSDVERGSIKSVLGSIAGGVGSFINKQSINLVADLIDIESLDSPDKIESLIVSQENKIKEDTHVISPHLDRVIFTEIISEISAANDLLENDETVEIGHASNNQYESQYLNTRMRVHVSPEQMISSGENIISTNKDYLDVIKPVNFGDLQWLVRSRTTGKQYLAFMGDKRWLRKYQDGLIPAITAKYCMIALVKLNVYKARKKSDIKRAEILEVIKIVSSDEVQDELF
ncbi:hypothetical protein ACG0Z5_14965 [Scandinavium sp. M-37]|uniref:hypothetical protein n=1 Tax=Scandinavium sp. M-37 TaxID=3373077 RepID=UPI003745EAF6